MQVVTVSSDVVDLRFFFCIDTGPVEVNVLERPEVGRLFTDTTEASLRQFFTEITDCWLKHSSFSLNRTKSETQQILISQMAA
jgi:hypothetical protein